MIEPKAVRNTLICAGAYYVSKWLALPLDIMWGKLTSGYIYSGDFAGVVLLPLVNHLPLALVAFGAGIAVALLVESDRRLLWLIFPAALYGCLDLLGYHWARPPQFLDRASQAIGALFPAFTCVIGGLIAARSTRAGPSN